MPTKKKAGVTTARKATSVSGKLGKKASVSKKVSKRAHATTAAKKTKRAKNEGLLNTVKNWF